MFCPPNAKIVGRTKRATSWGLDGLEEGFCTHQALDCASKVYKVPKGIEDPAVLNLYATGNLACPGAYGSESGNWRRNNEFMDTCLTNCLAATNPTAKERCGDTAVTQADGTSLLVLCPLGDIAFCTLECSNQPGSATCAAIQIDPLKTPRSWEELTSIVSNIDFNHPHHLPPFQMPTKDTRSNIGFYLRLIHN